MYRPHFAGFELNAGSALVGVFPASFQAATVGSVLTLATLFAAVLTDESFSPSDLSFWAIPAVGLMVLITTAIGTAFCAFYILLFGVAVAWLLGPRLASPLGLGVAAGMAVLAGLAATGVLVEPLMFRDRNWLFALMVMAYALPAGLFYRSAVLNARSLNPFAEPERTA